MGQITTAFSGYTQKVLVYLLYMHVYIPGGKSVELGEGLAGEPAYQLWRREVCVECLACVMNINRA